MKLSERVSVFVLGLLLVILPIVAFAIPENPGGINVDVVGCTGIYSIDTPTFRLNCVDNEIDVIGLFRVNGTTVTGVDTNAETICSGAGVLLDGEGTCAIDANTNAETECVGANVLFDGEGGCASYTTGAHTVDTAVTNLDSHDHNGGDGGTIAHTSLDTVGTSDHHTKAVSADIDHDSITGVSTNDHHTPTTDTSAAITCTGTNVLEGSGACVSNSVAGIGAWVLTASATVSAVTSHTFSTLSASTTYRLVVNGFQNTSNADVSLRFNSDSGANYGRSIEHWNRTDLTIQHTRLSGQTQIQLNHNNLANAVDADSAFRFTIDFETKFGSDEDVVGFFRGSYVQSNNAAISGVFAFEMDYLGSSTLSSITFLTDVGTFSGVLRLTELQ